MRFIDESVISAKSGDGGHGCVSFRREKYIPRGGPDGGDGGKGGDVIIRVDSSMHTLYDFTHRQHFNAQNGGHGQGRCKTGKDGDDIVIEVPAGTLVYDADTLELISDLTCEGQSVVLLKGGIGGRGNTRFKSSTNRAPRYAQPGYAGETRKIKLELKLLAQVGIVGLPNAGKSTLISAMSGARPKIGCYPFTTINPCLGAVYPENRQPFIAADIPGLIEGAHKGTGLGIKFLKHIERTGLLVHVIDADKIDSKAPLKPFNIINRELTMYGHSLAEKPQIAVLNKIDIAGAKEKAKIFRAAYKQGDCIMISAALGHGIKKLTDMIAERL